MDALKLPVFLCSKLHTSALAAIMNTFMTNLTHSLTSFQKSWLLANDCPDSFIARNGLRPYKVKKLFSQPIHCKRVTQCQPRPFYMYLSLTKPCISPWEWTHLPFLVPLFLLTWNLAPKDIARRMKCMLYIVSSVDEMVNWEVYSYLSTGWEFSIKLII